MSKSKYGTKFVETEALMACLEDDMGELNRILASMLLREQIILARTCEFLAEAARDGSVRE